MKFRFHIYYIEMQSKKSMVFGSTMHVNVRMLQISLTGNVLFPAIVIILLII